MGRIGCLPLLAGIRSTIHYGMKCVWYQLQPIPTKECLIEELVELWAGWAWQHQGLHTLVRDTLNPKAVA